MCFVIFMKRLLFTTAIVAVLTSAAFAEEKLKVSVGGSLDAQYGYRNQKGVFKDQSPGAAQQGKRLSKGAIVNDTKVDFKVEGKADNGIKYGGFIKIDADTSDAKEYFGDKPKNTGIAEQTMAFVETEYGRFEVGNYTGAAYAMKVNAANFASATGGIDGDSQYWWNRNAYSINGTQRYTRDTFLQTPNLPTNELGLFGIKAKNAAKVNVYTPEFAGMRFGISYVPDLDSYGTVNKVGDILKKSSNAHSYKNLVEAGLSYAGSFDNVGVKAAVIGQYAKPKSTFFTTTVDTASTYSKQRNLQAFEAGANLTYSGFKIGGSYGNWGKSNQLKAISLDSTSWTTQKGEDTTYWTAGLGYVYGPFSASLTYFESKLGQGYAKTEDKIKANKLRNAVLGVDYKMAPGFLPYAEISSFKMTDNAKDDGKKVPGNKGTIFLTGVKLNF